MRDNAMDFRTEFVAVITAMVRRAAELTRARPDCTLPVHVWASSITRVYPLAANQFATETVTEDMIASAAVRLADGTISDEVRDLAMGMLMRQNEHTVQSIKESMCDTEYADMDTDALLAYSHARLLELAAELKVPIPIPNHLLDRPNVSTDGTQV